MNGSSNTVTDVADLLDHSKGRKHYPGIDVASLGSSNSQ